MAGNSFTVEGKLVKIYDEQQVTASFVKREFVIEIAGNFPEYVKFELKQAKTTEINKFQEGDEICVHFNLAGRAWQDKYFTTLAAWRITPAGAQQGGNQPQGGYNNNQQPQANNYNNSNSNSGYNNAPMPTAKDEPSGADDLPF